MESARTGENCWNFFHWIEIPQLITVLTTLIVFFILNGNTMQYSCQKFFSHDMWSHIHLGTSSSITELKINKKKRSHHHRPLKFVFFTFLHCNFLGFCLYFLTFILFICIFYLLWRVLFYIFSFLCLFIHFYVFCTCTFFAYQIFHKVFKSTSSKMNKNIASVLYKHC